MVKKKDHKKVSEKDSSDKKVIEKNKDPVEEEDFWDTESEPEDNIHSDSSDTEELEDIDIKKLKFVKIKDLSRGMTDINIEVTIDFVGEIWGRGYGEEPHAVGFVKDDTGEVKMTFWGDACRKAKKGKKIRIIKGYVTEYAGQLQLNANRNIGVEFL